jgi:O6-methylguanine-DNA--protein-cysteine methyltransferase
VPRGRRAAVPNDAQEILQQLISEGRISAQDVDRCRQITDLERQLAALRGGGGARRRGRPPGMSARGKSTASSSVLTSEQRASRQLQGRYLALVRRIPAGKRARFGQIAKEKGREAAIRAMQSEVGSSKPAATAGGGKRRRRSVKLSSEQLASRQLQGRYLGLIRQIPASQRARYKKIVKDKGREAAIKELQSAVK